MISTRARIFATSTAIAALAGAALLAGCKGTTSAANIGGEKHVGPPPNITILPVEFDQGNPAESDPKTNPLWAASQWYNLTAPANTTLTTPGVRASMMYDARNIYVAFVADTVPPPAAPVSQDLFSVYLDTTPQGDGREMVKISVSPAGRVFCTQIESGSIARPKDDGSPDKTHPFATETKMVPGLSAKTMTGTENGSPIWMAVLTIPIQSLPGPLSQKIAAGTAWKVNLVRTMNTVDVGSGPGILQANLSPVYAGMQEYSPYRMATMTLGGSPAKK